MERHSRIKRAQPQVGLFVLLSAVVLLAAITILGPLPPKWSWLLALPLVLLLGIIAWYAPRLAFYSLLLFLPFSVYAHLGDSKISLPGEAWLFLLGFVGILQWITGRWPGPLSVQHPITWLIGGYFSWLVISALGSEMPWVSLKYLLLQAAYIGVFFFLLTSWLRQPSHWSWLPWLYTLPVLVLVVYTTWRHAGYGFVPQVNKNVPSPFFNDHTIYGAVLALLLPFWALRLLLPRAERLLPRWALLLILIILLTGIFLSYSRAVWISVVVIFLLGIFIALRLKVRYLVLLGLLLLSGLFFYRMPLQARLNQVSSERGGAPAENLASSANINSSVSNLERLNRWKAAWNMFREKPHLGFGPGTYPMQYGPYQDQQRMTRLSTYLGDAGGVHSEYLKPLAESGWPALLLFAALLAFTFQRGMALCYHAPRRQTRLLATAFVLGLVGYWTHGLFNFFLDTDKTALLHWGFIAGIVSLDTHLAAGRKKDKPHASQ